VAELETARVAELKVAADCNQGGGSIRAAEVDREAQLPPKVHPVEATLDALVYNVVEEFGFAPRDVYGGIFNLQFTRDLHATKMNKLTYSDLLTLSNAFANQCLLHDQSHCVVAVQPYEFIPERDRWTIDFKSPHIAKKVVGLMLEIEHCHLRDTYHLLCNLSAGMVGTLFESIAHQVLSGNKVPESTLMTSDNGIPPTFFATDTLQSTIGSTPSTFSTPSPYVRVKSPVHIDLPCDLHSVTDINNRYYIPTSVTNPLFDSFTITLFPDKHAAMVPIYQITTSQGHKGSGDGYLLIRKIIAHARKLLKCPSDWEADISVRYILVCVRSDLANRPTKPMLVSFETRYTNVTIFTLTLIFF